MTAKLPLIQKTCMLCQTHFETNASKLARARGRFCSRGCSTRYHHTRHGHTTKNGASRTYLSWSNMIARCTKPKSARYKDYGAKGIGVCAEWLSFERFLADMGERPEGTSIDRIDGALGYSPDNCRWATPTEQSDNLRTVLWVFYKGDRMTLSALSRILGIKKGTLKYRIERGWSDEALASPAWWGDRSRNTPGI